MIHAGPARPIDTHLYSPMNNRRDGENDLLGRFQLVPGPLDVYRRLGSGDAILNDVSLFGGGQTGKEAIKHCYIPTTFLSRGGPSVPDRSRSDSHEIY